MSWIDCLLGDVLELKRGYDLPNDQRKIGDIPVVSSSGITGFHNKKKVTGPAVVTGRYGTLGEVFYVQGSCWPLNTALYVKDFKGNRPRFIYYYLQNILKGVQSDKAAVPGLNRNDLHARKVRFVKGNKAQESIENLVSPYDGLIANNRRRIQLLEESAQLHYKEWFVELRFPSHEHINIIDGVPEGWKSGVISDYFDTTSGGTPSRKNPEYFEGEINWVKTKELDERYVFETEEKITEEAVNKSAAKVFPAKSLLVSIYGGSNIGRTGILDKPSASNQACVVLLPKRQVEDYMFVQQWFKHNRMYLIGLSQGAAQTNINQQTLKSLPILWPKAELIDLFIDDVRPIYRQIRNLALQIIQLEKARDILLIRLMNGELVV